jgi:glycosidase
MILIIIMYVAHRSVPKPPIGLEITSNLRVLADTAAACCIQKLGSVVAKPPKRKKTKRFFPHVYELYPPDNNKNERWFCQFIKNIDDKTFLGRWCLADRPRVLDRQFKLPVVFEWCTVKF